MTPDPETRAAMMAAAAECLMDQYLNNKDWDDAKDVIENIDVSELLTAAILVLEARGYKVTGRSATMEMAEAGTYITSVFGPRDTSGRWTRMHDAAPGWGDGK